MRLLPILAALAVLASSVAAQTPPQNSLGSWTVEYERTISSMHSEPRKVLEHGRMTLRAVGDSVVGEMTIGDSASTDRYPLRGVSSKGAWTVYAEEPAAHGFGLFFSAVGAAMDWLRESVHGIQPVVVRFDLTAKGDSINGTRAVTGGMGAPRNSAVHGVRAKPPNG